MYRQPEAKVHHGFMSGPNRYRWQTIQTVLALVGVLALCYWPLSIFFFSSALPVVDHAGLPSSTSSVTFPSPTVDPVLASSHIAQEVVADMDQEDLVLQRNEDARRRSQLSDQADQAADRAHHPADVRRIGEMQKVLDRLTLNAQRMKDESAQADALHAEEKRVQMERNDKLRSVNDELVAELDKTRASLELARSDLASAREELARQRASTADGNITDYEARMPTPWSDKSWRERLGGATWHFLHNVAARYPDKPTTDFQNAAHDLFRSLQYLYPCDECRNHLNRNLRRVPGLWPPKVESREALSQWVCKLHNLVNTQLSKPIFPCAIRQLDLRYVANCDECVTDPSIMAGEDASPLEKPDRNAVAAAALNAASRVQAERHGWRDVDGDDETPETLAASMDGLTPQQKRERLLAQKQAQAGRVIPREPERKYTGGLPPNAGAAPCTYKVESWHQSSHMIDPKKVNVIVLFSPTCHVCKVYLPREIQQAHVKFSARGLNLVAIADVTPETEPLLAQFVSDEKLTYPIGVAPSNMVGAPYDKFIGKYKGVPAVLEIDPISCTVRKQLWGWRIEQIDDYLENRLPRPKADQN